MVNATDDAHAAYLAWRDADRSARADAVVVCRAADDREEAAARAATGRDNHQGVTDLGVGRPTPCSKFEIGATDEHNVHEFG